MGRRRFGSVTAPSAPPPPFPPPGVSAPPLPPAAAAAPACCDADGGGGEAWDSAPGTPAGTGGAEEFFGILARAGAASGTEGGTVVGELSW